MTAASGVAVVTGASRGLGRGIAASLASAGFDVVVGYHRDVSGAEAVVAEVEAAGRRAVAVAGDVAEEGTSKALLGACDAVGYIPQLGRIGSLNVGTATAIACYEVRRTAWTA